MNTDSELKLEEIFFPFASSELSRAKEERQRFVHYTSAAVAMSIIQKREIWMRKVSCMNDYMEVQHGLNCISAAWRSDAGVRLKAFLENNFPGSVKEIETKFVGWQHEMQFDTYVTCLSKHDVSEDIFGRLSMWRAYGGNPGVALVINGTPFFREENTIGVV